MTMDYDISLLPPNVLSYLETTNISTITQGDDLDIFFHCWIQSNCPQCLSPSNQYPCSWCAVSQACVPNTIYGYPFGILSPLKSADICPLAWRERWEMRARPFSCRCSSMTLVSVVVAVLATLIGVLLIFGGIKLGIWIGRKWKGRKEGWWRVGSWAPQWLRKYRKAGLTEAERQGALNTNESIHDEQTPLLA
jgi:hypothetical protein